MSKFIAIPKMARHQVRGYPSMSSEEKRYENAQQSMNVAQAHSLENLGLSQQEPALRVLDSGNQFQALKHVGAYVVNAESDDKLNQAKAVLEEDHYIVPNIHLAIPQPTLSKAYQHRPPQKTIWHESSGIEQAHQQDVKGQNVLVCVLDTGCDADHDELRNKLIDFSYIPMNPITHSPRKCRGFDVNGHGTHVCGIIAGEQIGIAPKVDLVVASVIESETWLTTLERIFIALNWMFELFDIEENLYKPTIINMSLGFHPDLASESEMRLAIGGIERLLSTLVLDFDVLPIVSIGNDGPGIVRAPGYLRKTLSVGAVDYELNPYKHSGGGWSPLGRVEPNIVGFGVNVLSCLERDKHGDSQYADMSGTSMAAPYVSGIAALYASQNPKLQGEDLWQHLLQNALPLRHPEERVGAGLARFQ